MSTSTTGADPADLLDRWLSHRQAAELPVQDVVEPRAAVPDPRPLVAAGALSAVEAGRVVVEAFVAQLPVSTGQDPVDEDGPEPAAGVPAVPAPAADPFDVPPVVASVPTQVPPSSRRPPVTPAPGSVTLPPRRGARRALTLLTALALAATVAAGAVWWSERTTTTVAVAGGLLLVSWALSALRSRATGTEVSIVDGVLRVQQGDSVHRFPLTGVHPPIEVLGAPSDRGWKVVIQRRGMGPYVITSRMTDPQLLTDAIRVHRPHA